MPFELDDYTYEPEKIYNDLEEARKVLTGAMREHDILEAFGDYLLARLIEKKRSDGISVTLAEKLAKGCNDWRVHRGGLAVAKEKMNSAKFHYDNLKYYADARRTQESTRKTLAALR